MIDIPSIPIYSSSTGSFGTSRDLPSLDLAFALDKTLTARRGPTPTFTRSQTSPTGSTYFGSDGLLKYAAANEPRFDHDPETFACKGLLIEEQRTNLALQSEAFPLPIWTKTNVTTAPNAIASPSGTVTADTLIEDTATSFHYIYQQFAKAASSSTYSYSIYYKNASGTRTVVLALTNGASSGKAAIFTTSGTVTATNVNIGSGAGFTFVSANVESVGNDWYRASIVVTSDTSTRLDAVTYLNNSTTVISSYTGLMSSVYLWGAQLEAGSFPTSYIPTTTTALTRSADVCSVSGGDFTGMYNQSEGTFVCRYAYIKAPSSQQNRRVISGGDTRRIIHGYSLGTNEKSAWYYDGVNNAAMVSGDESATVGVVIEPTVIHAVCGSFVGPDKVHNGNLLTSMTYIRFFELGSGHIASVKYFRKALTDAKLQSLTTP